VICAPKPISGTANKKPPSNLLRFITISHSIETIRGIKTAIYLYI
jgi:hypothetical protein